MKLKFVIGLFVIFFLHTGIAQQKKEAMLNYAGNLKVVWSFKQDRDKAKSFSKFIISNSYNKVVLQGNWSLYFNCMKDIDLPSISNHFLLEHISGDLYRISPEKLFGGIKPRDSLIVSFLFSAHVVNFTDGPSGLFFVANGKAATVLNYEIDSSQSGYKKIITLSLIYQQNKNLASLSDDKMVKIFPTPSEYFQDSGSFNLNINTVLITDTAFKKEAGYLSGELENVLLKKIKFSANAQTDFIKLEKLPLAENGYQLSVKKNGITISASDNTGIFYGIQSLKSLLPPLSWSAKTTSLQIPFVTVKDKPRFTYRGLMIDVARNFQPLPQLLKIIDLMALYKLNVLHLHLCDDEGWRLEIPSLPELTEVGSKRGWNVNNTKELPAAFGSGPNPLTGTNNGFYTKEAFISILKYAYERHITVIPEIETPGHARAAIKAMDVRYNRLMRIGNSAEAERYLLRDINDSSKYISAQLFNDNVMCVALPSVYNFIEKITDELKNMYAAAAVPFSNIHYGGDEVPAGAWMKSPVSNKLISANNKLKSTDDLWYYFIDKINDIAKKRGLTVSGWEEIALRKNNINGKKITEPNPSFVNENFKVDVWNNVTGFGSEDLPYQLANAGYKVILSCTSNFYLDLANDTSFAEPGHYWGGFIDLNKVFSFIPFNYYFNISTDYLNNPVNHLYFASKERLTEYGKLNIIGIKATLFSEKIKTTQRMEYMLLPRLLAVAEKAWAKENEWEHLSDSLQQENAYLQSLKNFINTIGKRELPRLDFYHNGFSYRIPPAGIKKENNFIIANTLFSEFAIRYTTDGSEPNIHSKLYQTPIKEKGIIKLKVFDKKGNSSAVSQIENL